AARNWYQPRQSSRLPRALPDTRDTRRVSSIAEKYHDASGPGRLWMRPLALEPFDQLIDGHVRQRARECLAEVVDQADALDVDVDDHPRPLLRPHAVI